MPAISWFLKGFYEAAEHENFLELHGSNTRKEVDLPFRSNAASQLYQWQIYQSGAAHNT